MPTHLFALQIALLGFHLVRSSGEGEELHRFSDTAALQQEFCGPVDLKPLKYFLCIKICKSWVFSFFISFIRHHCEDVTPHGQNIVTRHLDGK